MEQERADRTIEEIEMRGPRPDTEIVVSYYQDKRGHLTQTFYVWDEPGEWIEPPEAVASNIFVNMVET